jgi:alpha-ketoglutarate-dependent taurine dioxygenase
LNVGALLTRPTGTAAYSFDKSEPEKYFLRPLIYHQPATESRGERVALQYARRYFVGFGALPRSADIPPISEAQAEALDTLHFLGERFHVSTNFQKGDMQYVNNLAVFHARDGFKDTPEKQLSSIRSPSAYPYLTMELGTIVSG